jgi:von Willebrand factor type D domain
VNREGSKVGRRWRHGIALPLLALVGAGVAPARAAADLRLVLPTGTLPGVHATAARTGTARADLAAGLPVAPARLADLAETQTSAASGGGVRLRSDAFVFTSAATATHVLGAWRRVRHARASGGVPGYLAERGSIVSVAWRERDRIGVISLRAAKRVRNRDALAVEYAVLADSWLRTPLPATAWGRVLTQIRPDGSLSKQTALEAFALAYGSVPGVHTPPGRRAVIPDGTLALQWTEFYFSRLTARQRRVVARRIGFPHGGLHTRTAEFGDPSFTQDAELTKLAESFVPTYEALLGDTLGLQIIAGNTNEQPKANTGEDAAADAQPLNKIGDWGSGDPALCVIRVTPAGRKETPESLKVILAHEVFHCFQFNLRGANTWNPLPDWIGEGTADWASLYVDPVPFSVDGGSLQQYIESPQTPLFQRIYDGIGFWGHAEDVNGDLWKRLPGIIINGQDVPAFNMAGADTAEFLNTWGSSIVRPINGGAAWHMSSPIPPPGLIGLGVPFTEIVGNGIVSAPAYTMAVYKITTPTSTPLLHVQIDGSARLAPTFNYTDLTDAWFCTLAEGCTCPPGYTDEIPRNKPLPDRTILGLAGDPGLGLGGSGTSGTISAFSLKDFCKPQPPNPAPFGGGPGLSNGDPYITTFDGGGYGFQLAGEFTLVKSTVDNLEIQSRQVPYPTYLYPQWRKSLAMNTAFAMRDGAAIVEIDKGAPLVLYINHHRRRARAGDTIRLPGGGRVRYSANDVIVTWRDGTKAELQSIGVEGVNVAVTPSRNRAGLLTGLLGNDNGTSADDYVGRSGHRYSAKQIQSVGLLSFTRRQIRIVLGGFGRSWRISQRTSLFVYPPGKSTRSYLVRGFPRALISLASLLRSRRLAAMRVCRRAHVTNPTLLAGCMIDYGGTGDHRLVAATGRLQRSAGIQGSARPVPWTQLSSRTDNTSTLEPTIETAAGRVVAAYRRSNDQAIEVASFDAGSGGVSGVSRALTFTGWQSTTDPVLLPAPGGGAQVIEAGQHSGNTGDPLNGTVISRRNADGSFGTPALLSAANNCCRVAGAVLAADGTTPLWVTGAFGMQVYSGSTSHDLTANSPGAPRTPVIGRDAAGRVWLAWYVISSTPGVGGIYMMQLDPQTGTSAGPPMLAPASAQANTFETLPMACGKTCRVVYASGPLNATKILSWAPGEPTATTVFAGNGNNLPTSPSAAFAGDGQLWVAWVKADGARMYAKLGDARGAGGTAVELPTPYRAATPALTAATTLGDRLVLVTNWMNDASSAVAIWGTVVSPG